MDKLKLVEATQLKTDIPKFKSGDIVNVHVKVKEGDKERIQEFQGIVIGQRGSGVNATFTVRKISDGVGVERIFPSFSSHCKDREGERWQSSPVENLLYSRFGDKSVAQKTNA